MLQLENSSPNHTLKLFLEPWSNGGNALASGHFCELEMGPGLRWGRTSIPRHWLPPLVANSFELIFSSHFINNFSNLLIPLYQFIYCSFQENIGRIFASVLSSRANINTQRNQQPSHLYIIILQNYLTQKKFWNLSSDDLSVNAVPINRGIDQLAVLWKNGDNQLEHALTISQNN